MLPTAKIGPYTLPNPLIVAPMAGVTDRPFRLLCRRMGAGLAVSEMVIADSKLWHTRKSRTRLNHEGEPEPRSVQIAGGDPESARTAFHEALGVDTENYVPKLLGNAFGARRGGEFIERIGWPRFFELTGIEFENFPQQIDLAPCLAPAGGQRPGDGSQGQLTRVVPGAQDEHRGLAGPGLLDEVADLLHGRCGPDEGPVPAAGLVAQPGVLLDEARIFVGLAEHGLEIVPGVALG